jgi:hypothetical protein
MTIDGYVGRRIDEDGVGLTAFREFLVGLLIEGVAAINPVLTQNP